MATFSPPNGGQKLSFRDISTLIILKFRQLMSQVFFIVTFDEIHVGKLTSAQGKILSVHSCEEEPFIPVNRSSDCNLTAIFEKS